MKVFDMELVYAKKLEIDEVSKGNNKELNLEYYLLASETNATVTYGIQISLLKENGESETVIIPDVLASKPNMMELINRLYSNSVTPVSVYDVIYDCIA